MKDDAMLILERMEKKVADLVQLEAKQKIEQQKRALRQVQPEAPIQIGKLTLNASQLKELMPDWSQEKVFQMAREEVRGHRVINPITNRLRRPIVAWVRSSSGNGQYEIKLHEKYGLGCSCRDYIFRPKPNTKNGRWCKH
jgi:hypothetical protein